MLLEKEEHWEWATFVFVYPSRHPSFSEGVQKYSSLLAKPESFQLKTLEWLLGSSAFDVASPRALADRYLW